MTRTILIALVLTFASACTDQVGRRTTSQAAAEASWWQWHTEKRDVEIAMDAAIDETGGGNWAKAVDIMRASDWPTGIKNKMIGMMIIQSYDVEGARRPPETLQQGLELVELAATQSGESREVTPQALRMMFERGMGIAPNNIPIDSIIAHCWHKIENGGVGDPARCIVLRRQRLPKLGR